jgi:hypothetical protein
MTESADLATRHVERLREYFALHRPDNVPKAGELFDKLGVDIWGALESKYGGTATFVEASLTSHRGGCVLFVVVG